MVEPEGNQPKPQRQKWEINEEYHQTWDRRRQFAIDSETYIAMTRRLDELREEYRMAQ